MFDAARVTPDRGHEKLRSRTSVFVRGRGREGERDGGREEWRERGREGERERGIEGGRGREGSRGEREKERGARNALSLKVCDQVHLQELTHYSHGTGQDERTQSFQTVQSTDAFQLGSVGLTSRAPTSVVQTSCRARTHHMLLPHTRLAVASAIMNGTRRNFT